MTVIFSRRGWEDYLYWQSNDMKLLVKINALIEESRRTPYEGTGRPEPSRGALSGWWSRRITQEHRLVYRPSEQGLLIAQCRLHY
jgi:toxin YoeB